MEFEVTSRPEDAPSNFEVVSRPPDAAKAPGLGESIQELPGMLLRAPGMVYGVGKNILDQQDEDKKVTTGEITQILGQDYDPNSSFNENYLRQIDITRNDNLADKQKKFLKSFPAGDLIEVHTKKEGPVLLARESKEAKYRALPAAPRVAGAILNEPTIGAIGGSFFTPIGTVLGTMGGLSLQDAIEKERGYNQEDFSWLHALKEGGISGAVDALTRGATRLIKGPHLPPYTAKEMGAAVKAAADEGLEPLTTGQVGGPLKRGVFRQVGAISPMIEEKVAAQERSLLEAFKRLGDDFPRGTTDDSLKAVVRAQQRELEGLMSLPPGSRLDMATAIQEGLQTYEKASQRLVGRLYNKAIANSDDVVFNLRPAQELADEIKAGVRGKAQDATGEAIRLSNTPEGELARVVDDLSKLDPTVAKFSEEGQSWTAFEQIKTLRTRLFDLKQSEDGAVRREASRLWKSLTEVMDKPISGNPEFVEAYKKASFANRIREENLSKTFVARALQSDTPETLARKYFQPGHAVELQTLQDLLPRPQFEQMRQALQLDLINSPMAAQGIRRFRNFQSLDPEGWKIISTPPETARMAEYLIRRAQFEASPARHLIEKNLEEGEKILSIARQGSAGDVADAVRLAGGKDSNLAKSMRAGVYKSILDDSTALTEHGVSVLDANKLVSSIQAWMKSGKLDSFMGPKDWDRLSNFQRYGAILGEAGDIGGPMMAGALRQKIVQAPGDILLDPGSIAKRIGSKIIHPLVANNITAWLLSRPASYSQIIASGGKQIPFGQMAAALTTARQEYE